MRIGIDASRANLVQKTGTEWYAFHLLKAFFEICHPEDEIRLYVKDNPLSDWGELPRNVKFKILKWPPKFLWTQLRLSWEMLWHPVDLLFVPAHTVPVICPANTITALHDIGFEHAKKLYDQKKIGMPGLKFLMNFLVRLITLGKYGANEYDYHRFSARLALKKCKRILTVSEYSKQDIANTYKIDPNRVIVVPNAVETQVFNAQIKSKTQKLNEIKVSLNISDPYIMTLGRVEKKKNSLGLVEAFKLVKKNQNFQKHKLLLVGSPGSGFEEVKDKIQELKLEKEVIITGWLENQKIPILLAGAEIFVMPSLFEGFGVPVIEAMAVGTPVVCSNLTSFPEVVAEAAILVNPNDPKNIAEGILNILNNQTLADQLIQKGYQRAKEFTWPKSAELLSKLIYE